MLKAIDSWWTVLLVDPVASRVVPRISRWPTVTPTRITAVAHLLGLAAATAFARGDLVLGALVFELRFFLDCMDGKLARVRGESSSFGRWFDAIGDRVIVMLAFGLLGWQHAPIATAVLLGAYPLSLQLVDVRDGLLAANAESKRVERIASRGYGAFMARHRLYPIPTSIEAEHAALFVAPLLHAGGIEVLEPAFWLTAAFFVAQSARYLFELLRAAARLDRTGR